MFAFVFLSTYVSLIFAQTCSNGQGICLSTKLNNMELFFCPEGMACLQNSTCCEYADIITSPSTTTSSSPSTCVDKMNPSTGVSDCPKNANLCNNAVYYTMMTEQCPKTCNRCGGSNNNNNNNNNSGSSTCVDLKNPSTGVSECAEKAYLCKNSAYKTLMRTQCPKTCGFC